MVRVTFYSDMNFSHVTTAIEQEKPDIDIVFDHVDLTLSFPDDDQYLLVADFVEELARDYSGDIAYG